jgi:carboxyl-terminal processing protease
LVAVLLEKLVQREMDLTMSSAVRLTVARYYTPTGRSIQNPTQKAPGYLKEVKSRFKAGGVVLL